MKNPFTAEEIDKILHSFNEEDERNKYYEEKYNRYEAISKGTLEQADIFAGSVRDFLYSLHRCLTADIGGDIVLDYNKLIEQVFNDMPVIDFKINNFYITIKKPLSLKDMTLYKKIISETESRDFDDFVGLSIAMGDLMEVAMDVNGKRVSCSNVENISINEANVLIFLAPVLYAMLIVFVNSIGAYTKKKIL